MEAAISKTPPSYMSKFVDHISIPFAVAFILLSVMMSCNQETKNADDAKQIPLDTNSIKKISHQEKDGVYFINLKEGDTIKTPFNIEMGIRGMMVEPAGKSTVGRGHHHLIIDGSFIEKGKMVPKDKTHIHFGKAEILYKIELKPGHHTLTLQFADGMHKSYGGDWSKTISITVHK